MSDRLVKEIVSAGGQDRVIIHRNDTGLYYYTDEFLRVHTGDDDFGDYPKPVALWAEDHRSGFYASAEDAERDARREVAWLRSGA
ncbi:MAG: hypothetical protein J0H01_30195 [Rhizobiales bacterium]|nr:hypothetical protein [Hyphomicrobiales bacterium]